MALIDEIRQLQENSLAALDASYDYYTHTKEAWRLVQRMVRQGQQFIIRSQATGSTLDEHSFARLAPGYITRHLASATFQQFVSLLEDLLVGFLRAWLIEYPMSMREKQLSFRAVLESADKAEIVRVVVEEELSDVARRGVSGWFAYLDRIAKLGCPTQDRIDRLAEIKASRDVLVHNRGIANATYVRKAMKRARVSVGERIDIPEPYHRESWQLIKGIVADISDAAIETLGR